MFNMIYESRFSLYNIRCKRIGRGLAGGAQRHLYHHMDRQIEFQRHILSISKISFGASKFENGYLGTKDDLKVKVLKDDNGNVMKATDLFNSPNAPYTQYNSSVPNHRDHEAPADIFNALRYKTLPSILTEKNIGDPRWR